MELSCPVPPFASGTIPVKLVAERFVKPEPLEVEPALKICPFVFMLNTGICPVLGKVPVLTVTVASVGLG